MMLFCECLQVAISKGNKHGLQAELLEEVKGHTLDVGGIPLHTYSGCGERESLIIDLGRP